MRAAGRPRSSTVASVIAFGVDRPAPTAAAIHRLHSTIGSGSQSSGSSGVPWYSSPSRHNRSFVTPRVYHAGSHLVLHLFVAFRHSAARGHEAVEALVHLLERGLEARRV